MKKTIPHGELIPVVLKKPYSEFKNGKFLLTWSENGRKKYPATLVLIANETDGTQTAIVQEYAYKFLKQTPEEIVIAMLEEELTQ